MKILVKDILTEESIKLGEWGVYSFSAFEKKFGDAIMATQAQDSDEPMLTYSEWRHSLEDLLTVPNNRMTTLELMAFPKTIKNVVPRRKEDTLTGDWAIENPIRGARPGAGKARIPKYAPDIYKYIIEGSIPTPEQKISGHAIILGIDNDIEELELDDPFTREIKCRDLSSVPANAFAIDNRFPTFIRYIDPRIVRLITKIHPDFVNYKEVDLPYPKPLVSLPYGTNLVTFPKEFANNLSDITIYNLYTMFKATQQAIKHISEAYKSRVIILTGDERDKDGLGVEDIVTNMFMNIGELVGGTIPRLHIQIYIRARTLRDKCYEKKPAKLLREQHNHYMSKKTGNEKMWKEEDLLYQNRNCNLFSMPIPSVSYETKIELKDKTCSFEEYSEEELWDLAEMLIFNSIVLDKLLKGGQKEEDYAGKDRNVLFYDTGVVVRPFSFGGGIEQGYPALITPVTIDMFEQVFNEVAGKSERLMLPEGIERISESDCTKMYKMPTNPRSENEYRRLLDLNSPLFKKARI